MGKESTQQMDWVAGNQDTMNVHCLGVESQIASQEYPSSCLSQSYVTTAQRYAMNSQVWTSCATTAFIDRKSTVKWCCSWPHLGGIQKGIATERRVQWKNDFPLVKGMLSSPIIIPSSITAEDFIQGKASHRESFSFMFLMSPLKLVQKF